MTEHNKLIPARWLEVYSDLNSIKHIDADKTKFWEIYNHVKVVHSSVPEDNKDGTDQFFRHYHAVIFRGEELSEGKQ